MRIFLKITIGAYSSALPPCPLPVEVSVSVSLQPSGLSWIAEHTHTVALDDVLWTPGQHPGQKGLWGSSSQRGEACPRAKLGSHQSRPAALQAGAQQGTASCALASLPEAAEARCKDRRALRPPVLNPCQDRTPRTSLLPSLHVHQVNFWTSLASQVPHTPVTEEDHPLFPELKWSLDAHKCVYIFQASQVCFCFWTCRADP